MTSSVQTEPAAQAGAPLLALDLPSLYFRAYYGVPASLTAPDGRPANAFRGVLDMTRWLIEQRHPRHVVAALDADWRPEFRVAAIGSYKAHRVADAPVTATQPHASATGAEELPDDLAPQVEALIATLTALGLPCVGVAGFEADDVLGSLAVQHSTPDTPVEVVTGDRDLFQLVDDAAGARVLYVARGVSRYETIDEAAVTERYTIPGRAYADYAILRGDPSDGLPGVPGIGEKTAASLISRYGNLAGVVTAVDTEDSELTARQRKQLAAARDYLSAATVVTRVVTDLELPPLHDQPRDPEVLAALTHQWGVERQARRLAEAFNALAAAGGAASR